MASLLQSVPSPTASPGAAGTATATSWHATGNDIVLGALWPIALVAIVLIIAGFNANVRKHAIDKGFVGDSDEDTPAV